MRFLGKLGKSGLLVSFALVAVFSIAFAGWLLWQSTSTVSIQTASGITMTVDSANCVIVNGSGSIDVCDVSGGDVDMQFSGADPTTEVRIEFVLTNASDVAVACSASGLTEDGAAFVATTDNCSGASIPALSQAYPEVRFYLTSGTPDPAQTYTWSGVVLEFAEYVP